MDFILIYPHSHVSLRILRVVREKPVEGLCWVVGDISLHWKLLAHVLEFEVIIHSEFPLFFIDTVLRLGAGLNLWKGARSLKLKRQEFEWNLVIEKPFFRLVDFTNLFENIHINSASKYDVKLPCVKDSSKITVPVLEIMEDRGNFTHVLFNTFSNHTYTPLYSKLLGGTIFHQSLFPVCWDWSG